MELDDGDILKTREAESEFKGIVFFESNNFIFQSAAGKKNFQTKEDLEQWVAGLNCEKVGNIYNLR